RVVEMAALVTLEAEQGVAELAAGVTMQAEQEVVELAVEKVVSVEASSAMSTSLGRRPWQRRP
ncbi:MAG: hypothetical protein SGPRY_013918, partial [Prymnesium sp.]